MPYIFCYYKNRQNPDPRLHRDGKPCNPKPFHKTRTTEWSEFFPTRIQADTGNESLRFGSHPLRALQPVGELP